MHPNDTVASANDRRRGRPRDPAIDGAALTAARELLAEIGWDGTTMVAIAERADVGKPALYRRWPSKTHLVFEALFGWVGEQPPITAAADPENWARQSFAYTLGLFARPEVRAAVPGLIGALRDHPDLQASLWREFGTPGVAMLAETLRDDGVDAAAADRDAQATMVLIMGASMLVGLLGDDASTVAERLPALIRIPR